MSSDTILKNTAYMQFCKYILVNVFPMFYLIACKRAVLDKLAIGVS